MRLIEIITRHRHDRVFFVTDSFGKEGFVIEAARAVGIKVWISEVAQIDRSFPTYLA